MLSIIIPAYNEEKRISKTLKDYYKFLQQNLKEEFEIIVVVNNSTDKTINIIKSYSKRFKNIIPIELNYYTGKGGAVIEGFINSLGDYVAFVDADNSIIPEEFWKLYERREYYDVVISSRRIEGARVFPPREVHNDLSSWLFNKVVRFSTGLKICDSQCGAKIFNRKVINKFLKYNDIEKGWSFDVDLLNICKANSFIIKEQPINWEDSFGSKLTFKDSIKATFKLFYLKER